MNTFTIYRKELSSYFRSPIAYGVMGFFALITGWFFYVATASFLQRSNMSIAQGQNIPMDVDEWVVKSVLGNVSVIGLFLIPMITMRLFAEEKRSGTLELLITSPLRDWEIILGKWMAAMALYICMLAISFLNIAILFAYGNPDWRVIAVGYLGLILQGACLLAIGTFISTCTKNQIVAGVAGFGVLLLLWVLDWVSSFESSTLYKVIAYFSVTSHFDSFSRGVIDSKDTVYYVTMTILGLFLTKQSLESLRWRA